jgi:hypothetical protein
MCVLMERATGESSSVSLAELMAVLPDWNDRPRYNDYPSQSTMDAWNGECEDALKKLKELTLNCPACILAALRQKGFPAGGVDWSFTAAARDFFARMNDAEEGL